MNVRTDLRSYAGETLPPFAGVIGHTDTELADAYDRGQAHGAMQGILWATLLVGTGCGWLLWAAGVL